MMDDCKTTKEEIRWLPITVILFLLIDNGNITLEDEM